MRVGVLLVISWAAASSLVAAEFSRDIEPIFHQRCYVCHGPTQQMSGLRLDRAADALNGGYSGAVLIPGDAAASQLLDRVRSDREGFKMPPGGARLSAAETTAIAEWIDAGAVWPQTEGTAENASSGASHWAFRSVARPALPEIDQKNWVRNPIDRFVLARLEAEGTVSTTHSDPVHRGPGTDQIYVGVSDRAQ